MTYCVNPNCTAPENPDSVATCVTCGSQLLLNQRYQPIRVLGQGGFGATFIARNMLLPGQPVCAVKQLRIASDNPQAIDRARQLFEREATTLGKIGNHPQVPSLLDYFEDNCQFYLVQEYVKGWTLKQEVKRSGPFDDAKIRAFLLETLTLLKYFQQQEVIHRDIKPANIIRRSIDGHLVFIDFGAVKDEVSQTMLMSSEDSPNTAFAIGTPGFAPPEQLGMHPTYASDIYALGATCLYLMTGQSPKRFGRDPRTGAINWHEQIRISAGLTAILDKMLQPETALRYTAAALVINDLQRLNAQPIAVASPPPTAQSAPAPVQPAPPRSNRTAPTQAPIGIPNRENLSTDKPPALNFAPNSSPQFSPRSKPAARPNNPPQKWKSLEELHAEQNEDRAELDRDDEGMSFDMPPLNASNLAAARFHTSSPNSRTSMVKTSEDERVTVRSLCRAYSQGHRDFANCNLSGADLHGIDLSEVNFHESKLIRTNLSSTNLYKADLSQAGLSQANFRDANLTGAFLSYANLAGADLRGANLSSAHLSYANLNGANLSGANLTGARVTPEQLSQAKTNWRTIMPNGKRGLFS